MQAADFWQVKDCTVEGNLLLRKTGNANNTCHLHLGLSPVCARTGDWWIRRGVVWPWRYLDAWRTNTATSPAAEVQSWHADHGCPPPP